ncbi:hypothetical protein [Streptomyces sp. URMC 129]|uniref:hypothetical protein n=1 Tax=Streptomyces sp. URMC 129 TaxID=3423407 RepID=UPI003F1D2D9A
MNDLKLFRVADGRRPKSRGRRWRWSHPQTLIERNMETMLGIRSWRPSTTRVGTSHDTNALKAIGRRIDRVDYQGFGGARRLCSCSPP